MDEEALERLEHICKVLSNINRLRLLVALQSPKGYSDIQLSPSRSNGGSRTISRQAVRGHIDALMELGLVVELDDDGHRSVFALDESRLFAAIDNIERLCELESDLEPESRTLDLDAPVVPRLAQPPHLVLVRGAKLGECFCLSAPNGSERAWTLGRSPKADLALTYDPYISRKHARIIGRGDQYLVEDLEESKNGTFLNGDPLRPGSPMALSQGDLIGVGRSLLVFRS